MVRFGCMIRLLIVGVIGLVGNCVLELVLVDL